MPRLSSRESKRSKSAPAFAVQVSPAHWSHPHCHTFSLHVAFIRLSLLISNCSGIVVPRKYPSSLQKDVEITGNALLESLVLIKGVA